VQARISAHFAAELAQAGQATLRVLNGQRHRQLLDDLDAFLADPPLTPRAEHKAGKALAKPVRRAERRLQHALAAVPSAEDPFVRVKVACLRAGQGDPAGGFEARHLAEVGLRHLRAGAVSLVLVGGLPGTGKSALAGAAADQRGVTLLSSDRVRKELAACPPIPAPMHRLERASTPPNGPNAPTPSYCAAPRPCSLTASR